MSEMPAGQIATARDCEGLALAQIGGKAFNLVRAAAAGMEVPAWLCVTTAAFHDVLRQGGDEVRLLMDEAARADGRASHLVADDLQRLFGQASLAGACAAELLEAFDRQFGARGVVAVRSSAVSEDSMAASYAGQMRSHLNVDRAHLLDAVVDCLLSPFSPGCIDYRRIRGGRHDAVACAVVVQRMVFARASGVLFTIDPVRPHADQLVVTAAYGLGEGVVQDLAEADTVILSRSTGAVLETRIARKAHKVEARPAGLVGTHVTALDERDATQPVLRPQELTALYRTGMALEERFASPQDVEWAVTAEGTVHVLQARPITTLARRPAQVFDSSNISENYRGATTPLTFSYVRKYYDDIFRSVARMFGTPEALLARHRPVFRHLVGFVDGGLYYNMANWYRMFELVPGFPLFARPFEHGVGIDGVPAELRDQVAGFRALRPEGARRRAATLARIGANFASLPWRMRRLQRRYDGVRRRVGEVRLPDLSLEALAELFHSVQAELCPNWGAPLLNDYYSFIFFHALHRLGTSWGFDPDGKLLADLLRGEEDLASVGPIRAILELAQHARDTPDLAELIRSQPPRSCAALAGEPRFARFARALERYVEQFGDRRFDELKLESPSLEENPEVVFTLLGNYLRGQSVDVVHEKFRDRDNARTAAQRAVGEALAGRPLRRLAVAALVAGTRKSLAYREFGRLIRSQRCGLERGILLEMARRLVEAGALDDTSDLYFLTLEEIASYVAGASVTRALRPLVQHRRAEFDQHRRCAHPLRVVGASPVYASSEAGARGQAAAGAGPHAPGTLRGTGCSPGRARGRARVVSNPQNASLEPGDILVTRSTDPAWAFLMVAASALVVERGNLLSHAAIIGREIGIPCVIGLPGATSAIREGDVLIVDGTAGTVEVERAAPGPAAAGRLQEEPA